MLPPNVHTPLININCWDILQSSSGRQVPQLTPLQTSDCWLITLSSAVTRRLLMDLPEPIGCPARLWKLLIGSQLTLAAAEQLENNLRVFTSLRNFKLPLDHRAWNPKAEVDREKFNWSYFSQWSSCFADISQFQSDPCVNNKHKILSIAGGFWVSLIVVFMMFFPSSGDISVITLELSNMQDRLDAVWSDRLWQSLSRTGDGSI